MKFTSTVSGLAAIAIVATTILPGIPAAAQDSHKQQKNKNMWRNAAIGAGAVGVYGLLSHNNTLAVIGGAGSLYSLNRNEHDRKSQSSTDHRRAAMYQRSSFQSNGHRYVRKTIHKNGHK